MDLLHRPLDRHGFAAVPLPAVAAARADELRAAVPALLQRTDDVRTLAELADAWAPTPTDRAAVLWARRATDDPRGGKSHLQTVAGFDRFALADDRTPALLRGVLGRMATFGAAARRLLTGLDVRCTVRANVYEDGGSVPTHVDDSALTIVFTDQPGSLLVGRSGQRSPLRRVPGHGWHAVVLPGDEIGELLPGLVPSPHAAAPAIGGRRLSISVFARVGGSTLTHATSGTSPADLPSPCDPPTVSRRGADGRRCDPVHRDDQALDPRALDRGLARRARRPRRELGGRRLPRSGPA
jgi:hypothetical protein